MKPSASSLSWCGLLASAGPASAQDRRDLRVGDEIVRPGQHLPAVHDFRRRERAVEQGVVTLTGKVTMPYKKNDIGRRIAGIDGVREVQNNIGVLPVSIYDDQLRPRIARAIYGNPSFWNYAAMAEPAHPHHRRRRARAAHRGREQQRRAHAGTLAGNRFRRALRDQAADRHGGVNSSGRSLRRRKAAAVMGPWQPAELGAASALAHGEPDDQAEEQHRGGEGAGEQPQRRCRIDCRSMRT